MLRCTKTHPYFRSTSALQLTLPLTTHRLPTPSPKSTCYQWTSGRITLSALGNQSLRCASCTAQYQKIICTPSLNNNQIIAFGGDCLKNILPSYPLQDTWFRSNNARTCAIKEFKEAIKDNSTLILDNNKNTMIAPLVVLPTAFAPVLLLHQLSHVQAWSLLRALTQDHGFLSEAEPLFQ